MKTFSDPYKLSKTSGQTQEKDSRVWTTKKVNNYLEAIENGEAPKISPFYDGDINLRKPNLTFKYTKHEYNELKRCAKDIVYFAENYAFVMTEEGIKQIKLRKYQKRVLKDYQNYRFNVFLSCRQSGKCCLQATILIKNERNEVFETTIEELYYHFYKSTTIKSKILNYFKKILLKIYKMI